MSGGALSSGNGGLFYTTNADSALVLSGVEIKAEASDYFLRCTGNRRGWGVSGGNGANCRFTGIAQEMPGDVVWDSISNLSLYLTAGSHLRGAVIQDESCAGRRRRGGLRIVRRRGFAMDRDRRQPRDAPLLRRAAFAM